jgi:bacillithiol system protein YtxJ
MPLHTLTTPDALDHLLSAGHPVFLFKHSETCGMSHQAHEEVCTAIEAPDWSIQVHLVSVQASRPVSSAIAERLRVPHASPQVLLVEGGQVRWHASHLAITADAMREALERLALAPR